MPPPPVRFGPQTRIDAEIHPNRGGNPYSQQIRDAFVQEIEEQQDRHPAVDAFLATLRQRNFFPSQKSILRWKSLQRRFGHCRPCRKSGNFFATRLRGQDLVYLSIYRMTYPKVTIDEINAFLFHCNFGDPSFRFYTASQISTAESLLGLTRKKASTTAFQAFLPRNLRRRWRYWNLPFPMGIADVPMSHIIDLDECGIFVQTSNRNHGKSYEGIRVNEPGPYSKGEKWNLLMAICGEEGDIGNPSRRWTELWLEGGTTVHRMMDFVHQILEDIGPATEENFYVFTMDNLNSHTNVGVVALIHAYGHGVVFRAPYYAVDGPIEYVFNTLQALLRSRLYEIFDGPSLVLAIHESIQGIYNFSPYFRNLDFLEG